MLVKLKNILLVLAVCSTIIENMGGIPLYICIAYFIVSFGDYNSFRKIGFFSKDAKTISILWFSLFAYLTFITAIFSLNSQNSTIIDVKWLKSLLLFVFVLKDSFNKPKLMKYVVVSYAVAALVCVVIMMNGIGVELDPTEIGESRLTFLGTNANKMAMVYVYSFFICLFLIDRITTGKQSNGVLIKISGLLLIMIVFLYVMGNMASRGAFACVLCGLLYYFIIYKQTKSALKKIAIVFLGIAIIVYGYDYLSNIYIFSRRMEMMSEGYYGERDILVKAAFEIFVDNPVFGVGLSEVINIIGSHLEDAKTPHNLYLYVLSSGGIIGFSIFMAIIYKTVVMVFKQGYKKKRLLPILLFIGILLDYAKNGGALTTSVNYVFFAIGLSMCFLPNNYQPTDLKNETF